jgi:drug/metabolite transporter (DMT)-like permease
LSKTGWSRFALVGFIWGVPYLFLKIAVEEISPSVVVFRKSCNWRSNTSSNRTLSEMYFSYRANTGQFVLLYTITELVGPWYFITAAEQKITSGLAGLLVATVPIWAAILASIFGDKTVWHAGRLFGLIIGFIGVVAVAWN